MCLSTQQEIEELEIKYREERVIRENYEYMCRLKEEATNRIIYLSKTIYSSFLEHLKYRQIKPKDLSQVEQIREFNGYLASQDCMSMMREFLFFGYFYGLSKTKMLEEHVKENNFIRVINDEFVSQVQ